MLCVARTIGDVVGVETIIVERCAEALQ